MDIVMPQLDGLGATARIKHAHPEARILLITQSNDGSFQNAAAKAGADGFFSKDDLTQVRVHMGGMTLSDA